MTHLKDQAKEIETLVCFQLKQHWPDVNEEVIRDSIPATLLKIEKGFTGLPNKRYYRDNDVCFSPYMSVQWMIFLYRLSHAIYKNGGVLLPKKQTKYIT